MPSKSYRKIAAALREAATAADEIAAELETSAPSPAPTSPVTPSNEAPTPTPAPAPSPAQGGPTVFYVDGGSAADEVKALMREGMPNEAKLIRTEIAEKPQAIWYNGGDAGPLAKHAAAAKAQGKTLIACLYNVPGRDEGNHSAGGAASVDAYLKSVDAFVAAIGDTPAVVVIEPDAVNLPDYLDDVRKQSLNGAMLRVSKMPNAVGYVDAGHSLWRQPSEVATRLNSLAVPSNIGIAVNVSSWQPTAKSIAYARNVVNAMRGGSKHFIVDTSRNGAEFDTSEWCNPWSANNGAKVSFGRESTTDTGDELCDALLWVKRSGESDGVCGGGPAAGHWFRWWAVEAAKTTVARRAWAPA